MEEGFSEFGHVATCEAASAECASEVGSPLPIVDGTTTAVQWEEKLPTNEFFAILLDEAESRIGRRILGKIGRFRRYFDEDDVINESMRKLLRRLRRPIDGVAELSADCRNISFNCWKRVFGYLRMIVKFCIIELKRKLKAVAKQHHEDNETLSEVVAPAPTVVQLIKTQAPYRWVRAIKTEANVQQRKVALFRLKDYSDRQIANLLGTTHAKVRRCRMEMINCFRRTFDSPDQLLESMQS